MTIDKINDLDLLSVIRSYGLEPKKYGTRYKLVCPFHGDKDPSLVIYTGKGKPTWHCFGCHKHGDAADFIALYERKPLKAVLQSLGFTERLEHDTALYMRKAKNAVEDFRRKVRDQVVALGWAMRLWETELENPENAWAHPEGYDFYNQWWDWQERLILGSDEEKYEVSKQVRVNTLLSQMRKIGWF